MNPNNKVSHSFAWSFLEQGGSKAIQLVIQIILARLLAPEAFGVLAILLVVTQVADSIAQSGLGMALIQKSNTTDVSYSTAWWLSLGLATILYGILFFIAPAVASFYRMPSLTNFLRVMGVIVFFNSANSIQRSFLQYSMNFKSIFLATTISAMCSGVIGIVLAYAGFGVWALVAQTLIHSVIICCVMWVKVSWKPTIAFDVKEAKELFSYGWKICVTGILNVFYSGVSELIIGRACSTSELGFYSQGRKYPQVGIGVMTNAIANVLFPMFSLIKNNNDALQHSIKHGLKLGTFIVAPVSFLAAVVAHPLVVLLLTDKWIDCVLVFQLACLSNSILLLQLVNLRAYMALGDSALYMRLQIIKVLGGGVIIWATAAITKNIYITALANFFVSIFAVLLVDMGPAKHLHGYSALNQIKDVAPIFVLCLVSSGVSFSVQFLNLNYVVCLFLQSLVFIFVYIMGSKLLGFQEFSESKELLLSFLNHNNK